MVVAASRLLVEFLLELFIDLVQHSGIFSHRAIGWPVGPMAEYASMLDETKYEEFKKEASKESRGYYHKLRSNLNIAAAAVTTPDHRRHGCGVRRACGTRTSRKSTQRRARASEAAARAAAQQFWQGQRREGALQLTRTACLLAAEGCMWRQLRGQSTEAHRV